MRFMYALLLSAVLAHGVSDDAILIGMEREVQSFSADEENLGMRLVIRHVNDLGGIHGRKLVEIGYSRDRADWLNKQIANARRMVEEDGVFMLFNFGGPASMQIGPYAQEQRVPYMFPHTALLTVDGEREIFTSYPRYDGETAVILRYLAEDVGVKKVGVIYASNAYGQYFASRARLFAPELGYEVVAAETLARDADDAIAQMQTMKDLNADAVIMAVYPDGARRIMEAKGELDWNVRLVSSGPLTDEHYFQPLREMAEGTLGFCHYPSPENSDAPGIAEYRELMERYFPGHPVNRYSLYGYVMGLLVVEGLERAGRDLTRDAFIDAMESIRDWDSGGIMPPVSFSKNDHHAQTAGFICRLDDGHFTALTDWIEPDVPEPVEPTIDPVARDDEPIG